MTQCYRHLQYDERCQIRALHKQGVSISEIARQLGRHKSTVSRELRRNAGKAGYRHKQAQRKSEQRRRLASSGPRKLTAAVWNIVRTLLLLHWSPEQIAGRLKRCGVVSVSFSWLYQRIHQDRARGGKLYIFLRQRGRKRRCKAAGAAGRGCIPHRRDISERPAAVDEKRRAGDWEGDTIIGKGHQGAAVTLVERVSKYLVLKSVARKTAALVGHAVTDLPAPFAPLVLTLTFDNGKEFAGHRDIAQALSADVYFARPYSSWERGLNEHTNGLVRQYVGKGETLCDIDPARLQQAADRINHRPRRELDFRTPHEVFSEVCRSAAIPPPRRIPKSELIVKVRDWAENSVPEPAQVRWPWSRNRVAGMLSGCWPAPEATPHGARAQRSRPRSPRGCWVPHPARDVPPSLVRIRAGCCG